MDWSLSKVIRIETGAVGISTNDLRALLNLYAIHDSGRTDELIELARGSRQTSWLGKYRDDITPQYLQYIEYEEAASFLRIYEPLLLPGLVQTEEYAATIMRKLDPGTPEDVIRNRIEIRLTRQQLLERTAPPTLVCILDESTIRRVIGEPDIAHGQLARLVDLANRSNITIQVVPFTAGLHRGLLEPFIILEFSEAEDSDVLYSESSRDSILSHDEAGEITGYREVFEHLRTISLDADDTLGFLADCINRIVQTNPGKSE